MAVNRTTLGQAKYYPELFPDARVQTVAASSEGAALLDLRELRPLGVVLRLTDLAMEQNANISARINADELARTENFNSAAMPSTILASDSHWTARDRIRYALANADVGAVSDYRTRFGVWAYKPSVAQRLGLGLPLSGQEEALAQQFELRQLAQRGVGPPFDIDRIIRDEYKMVIHRDVVPVRITQATANTFAIQHTEIVRSQPVTDQFIVLAEVAAAPGTFDAGGGGGENVSIRVNRDEDQAVAEFRSAPLALTRDGGIRCWIPALRKIEIAVSVEVAVANHAMRFTFLHLPLTLVHRVRWGLIGEQEAERLDPGLWARVRAGVV